MPTSGNGEFEHLVTIILPIESSEEDVRSKIVIPLFKLLGYREDHLATEFPVYGNIGRKKAPTTRADAVYFNEINPGSHREESEKNWVRDHSLVLVEIKKPSEDPDPSGQAEYYAQWLATPYIVSTNGNDFIIRLQESYRSPKELMRFKRNELVSRLADIQKILLYQRVEKFVQEQQLKSVRIGEIDYKHYLSSLYEELKSDLKWPITRLLGIRSSSSVLDLTLGEKSNLDLKTDDNVLNSIEPIMILGGPGSGKTYFLKHLAKKTIESNLLNSIVRVPIKLDARYWGCPFITILDAIFDELHFFIPGITQVMIENELVQGRFVILVDGYDEIRNSKELFRLEIERLARIRMAKIIITSREANYHGEFITQFRECSIKDISDDQIDAFASDVAGMHNFSYYLLKKNLLELARLPLYLVMLCQLSMKDKELPNNKARIWDEFATVLLEDYLFRRNPAFDPAFSKSQKMDFLSEFAAEKANDIGFSDYAKSAHKIGIIKNYELLLKEILESGLLKGDASRLEFIHPTANEFFHARFLSIQSSETALRFVNEVHNHEEYIETILFLIGLLRDQGKQDQILDFLEENNLELCIKCLDARYHLDLSTSLNYPDVERRYLSQLQKTYNVLLDKYLDNIKFNFTPYRFMKSDPTNLKRFRVRVRGSLDLINSRISYEYLPSVIDDNELEPEIVKLTNRTLSYHVGIGNSVTNEIIAFSNGRHFYKDLNLARLGLDSAREVAVNDVFDRLNELVDKQHLLMTPIFACERIVSEIHKSASTARVFQDKELEPIWRFENGVFDAQEYLQAFESIKDHPFVVSGNRQIPLRIDGIIRLLKYLIADSTSIPNSVLPQISPFNRASGNSSAISTRCSLYDQKVIQERLERLYTILPEIYCEIIDLNFPKLRQYLGHCKIYPFKYMVNYSIGNGLLHEDYTISKKYHLPVVSKEEMKASVNLVEIENRNMYSNDYDLLRDKYIKMLRTFGRYSEANGKNFSLLIGGFDAVIDEKAITKGVYGLLKDDLERLFLK